MADSASESDSSSIDGGPIMMPPSPITREQLQKRIESLQQQNRVLKVELDTYKLKVKALQEENRGLRQASVIIQAKAEQEEEYISNTLLKKIQALKKEKETLAHHYEQEEECLTNDLSRKLTQLRQEKCKLEQTLEQEQECLVNKLMRKIEKLEAETLAKQSNLEQLRREKVELENTLEQEQEALVNRLWKRMDKLEAEKRMLQIKLDQPVSDPASPRDMHNGDTATNLSSHIQTLRGEVSRLRVQLQHAEREHTEKMERYVKEERHVREENLRLQRKLQLEVERREALCRHLSESESRDSYSSLEMEEERHYNEMASGGNISNINRSRTESSPGPYNPSPVSSRPLSPGEDYELPERKIFSDSMHMLDGRTHCRCYQEALQLDCKTDALAPRTSRFMGTKLGICPSFGPSITQSSLNSTRETTTGRCYACGSSYSNVFLAGSSSPPVPLAGRQRNSERFIKPAIPPPYGVGAPCSPSPAPSPASPMDTSTPKC